MGKLFNKLIYGDPNKKDFTKADLPHNRVDLFIDVFKTRTLGLITLNLIFLLFLLPIFLVLLYGYFMINQAITQSNMDVITSLSQTGIDQIINLILLVCIPLITLLGPAQAGMAYVIRNWAWGENAEVWKDFWKEFKRSWKSAAVYNLFSGAFIYAIWFWMYTLLNPATELNKTLSAAILTVVGILTLLYILISVYIYPLMVTFNLKLKQIVKNALIFSLMQLPRTFLFALCIGAFIAIIFLLPGLLAVLMLIVGFAAICLAQMVFTGFIFDKYMKHITGDEVPTRRGMAPETDKLGRKIKKDKK